MMIPAVTPGIWRADALRDSLLAQVATEVAKLGEVKVAIVQVGNNPASNAYVRNKLAACAKVGIGGELVHLDAGAGEGELMRTISALGQDKGVHAIIVQTPLPAGWMVQYALDAVPVGKDIDGLSSGNALLRRAGEARALWPATPLGVMRILEHLGVEVRGTRVAVIGKGMVVGGPLQEILSAAGAEVVGIDKSTANPESLCREADVIVAAAGAPGLVGKKWVKPGAVVIDVGLTRVEWDGKARLAGDVNRAEVEGIARVLSAAPGGVGLMTVASILTNVVDACAMQKGQPRPTWKIEKAA